MPVLENPETEEPQIFNLFVEEDEPNAADCHRPTAGTKCPNHPSGFIRFGKQRNLTSAESIGQHGENPQITVAIRKLREHFQKKAI